jgi:hypothetical protein
MEVMEPRRMLLLQTVPQGLGEQGVIAVPLPVLVERDHEQVRALQCFEQLLRRLLAPYVIGLVVRCYHSRAELGRELLEDCGVEEEASHPGRLPIEHLLGNVIQDIAVTTAQRVQLVLGDRSLLQPQADQL